jgi:hypothetical protein
MRKLVVSNLMSLEGYVEGLGGNLMVLPLDEFFDITWRCTGRAERGMRTIRPR